MGYDLVRIQISGSEQVNLQIMAERLDARPMTVDDCTAISRELSPLLDVEDVIGGPYALEVSSPGVDRPLVRRRDFERFVGAEIQAEMCRPIGKRRRFRGQLLGMEPNSW